MPVDGVHFLRPEAFWLLLLLPLAAVLVLRPQRRSGAWARVIDPELLPYLVSGAPRRRRGLSGGGLMLLLLTAIIAIAGPSFRKIDVPVYQRADAVVIVLDLSASMLATDVQPSRYQRARQKILDLLAERSEGVTGLVAYAGDAHVVTPLTDDTRTIENLLPALRPEMMPIPGADATSALALGASLLGAAGVRNGRLLLITDDMPRFDPDDIRDTLSTAGASLAILGMGSASGAPIPLPDGGFLRDSEGEIVVPRLDSATLGRFAADLGGRYHEVTLDNRDIDTLLAPTALRADEDIALERQTDTWLDEGHWLVALLAVGVLPLFRRGVLALLLVAPLLTPAPAKASLLDDLFLRRDQQAAAALADGDADTAASLFTDPAWRGTAQLQAGDPEAAARSFAELEGADAAYNLGNARALAGDLKGALAAYDRSLEAAPDREDAIRNRELVQRLLEQQQQEQPSDEEEQEQQSGQDESSAQDSEGTQEGQDSTNSNPSDGDTESPESSAEDASDPTNRDGQASDSSSEGSGSDPMQEALAEQLDDATNEQLTRFDAALEKQQALEQWLRRVPDDPSGLLQRKFRYESNQRIRKGEVPDETVRW